MANLVSKLTADSKGKEINFALLFVLLLLLCIGLIALASASSYTALVTQDDSNYYVTRQLFFAIVGVVVMIIISKIDYKVYEKLAYVGYAVALLLMLAVFVPGIGMSVKGAQRWINIGFTSLQPSEIMKPMLAIAIGAYCSKNPVKSKELKGCLIPFCMFALVAIVMYFQSHLSGILVMLVIAVASMIASGVKIKKIEWIVIGIILVVAVVALIFTEGYRLERLISFFTSAEEQDITGSIWQPTQSLYAIGSGGLLGAGIGQSRQKYLWLPESQNDFVFSIFAEEFGFVGASIVVIFFAIFITLGITVALKTRDTFGVIVVTGIMAMFAFQVIVNIAVVTKLIPTTGMPLPFFSSGGTSLLINLAAMGIVLNISRQGNN